MYYFVCDELRYCFTLQPRFILPQVVHCGKTIQTGYNLSHQNVLGTVFIVIKINKSLI